jgi:hypothetical protein
VASRHSQHRGEGLVDAGTPASVAAKAASINAAHAHPLTWKTVVKRALIVAVAGRGHLPGTAQPHRGTG